ncbi:MAG: hypothetical protein UX94_C0011G0018 [Parcubacteria group bacterium GW2011_GWA2_47_21]|nr:MAG: hypothetical protein UX94_C0011G0018 [Parcubacteria group bacterium GW2011_GWA2_47_21]
MFLGLKSRVADWWERNERRLSSFALFTGFIVDNLTLTRITLNSVSVALFSYLLVAGFCIIVLNFLENTPERQGFKAKIHAFTLIILQFTFGALFSGFLVFYSRGASIGASWPFLLILFFILIGNEFLRTRYIRIGFQMIIFFIALFSYSIFFMPIMTKKVGAGVFLLSGAASLLLIYLFLRLIGLVSPERFSKSKPFVLGGMIAVFGLMNFLYFKNLIPPLPLTLKEAAVFHDLKKLPSGEYLVTAEAKKWHEKFRLREIVRVSAPCEPLYFWSAVFAPTDLEIDVTHVWLKFSEAKGQWLETFRTTFPIKGGRVGGFRGFSLKERVTPGLWRVDVKTPRGQVIGRMSFRALEKEAQVDFVEEIK